VAVLLGLLAAVFYGAADFCGGLATRRSSIFAVTVISQAFGFVLLIAVLPFFPAHLTAAQMEFGAFAGLCGGIGIALLYHALSIGKMGVVSPITAVLAASLPVAVGVMRGEHLLLWQAIGIAIALVAIVLISLSHEPDGRLEFSSAGVKEAIASGIMLGGFLTFLALAGKNGGLYPLLCARAASALFLAIVALAVRQTIVPVRSTLAIIVFAGAIDMSANVLYVLASYAGYLSIAAVLTSLYPASTVFLARIVLHERLVFVQKLGVTFALLGVVLIASA
jgi:drug/metabolite transporter (DMT)-like permease